MPKNNNLSEFKKSLESVSVKELQDLKENLAEWLKLIDIAIEMKSGPNQNLNLEVQKWVDDLNKYIKEYKE